MVARPLRNALLALGLAAPLGGMAALAQEAAEFRPIGSRFVPVRAIPIERFSLFDGNNAGALTFLGGLDLRGRTPFSSLSGLDRLPEGDAFVAVTDRGEWVRMDVTRDAIGRLAEVETTMARMRVDATGRRSKDDSDAEAVRVLRDGSLAVSLEQRNRILRFDTIGRLLGTLAHPIPEDELRRNKGFEALALAPEDSALAGGLVLVTERSIDEEFDIFAAVLSGPRKGVFKIRRLDDFDVTDAVFLPDGDMLLLERSYLGRLSLRMRIRLIKGDTIRPGARVDGPILMTAGLTSEIDNMEGIAVHADERGTIVTLVSDDNGSFLQRTLLLEFLLEPNARPPVVPVPRMRPSPLVKRLRTTQARTPRPEAASRPRSAP